MVAVGSDAQLLTVLASWTQIEFAAFSCLLPSVPTVRHAHTERSAGSYHNGKVQEMYKSPNTDPEQETHAKVMNNSKNKNTRIITFIQKYAYCNGLTEPMYTKSLLRFLMLPVEAEVPPRLPKFCASFKCPSECDRRQPLPRARHVPQCKKAYLKFIFAGFMLTSIR